MELGSHRYDRMQRIWGWHHINSVEDNDQADGAFISNLGASAGYETNQSALADYKAREIIEFDSSRVTRTGQKTEPENVVLNAYIYTV